MDFHYSVETQLPWIHFDDDAPRCRCDDDPDIAAAYAVAEAGEYPEIVEIESSDDRFT
jgi:hypothetical protein